MPGPFWGLSPSTAPIIWFHLPADSSGISLPRRVDI